MVVSGKKTAKEILVQDPFIKFKKDSHEYFDLKTKRKVPRSISDLKKGLFYRNAAIEEGIERGNAVHEACHIYVETKDAGLAYAHAGKYKNYVENFINADFWNTWDVVVSEFMLIDRIWAIAGTLDLILQNKKTGELVLADIKTGKTAPNVKMQLGGYTFMIQETYKDIKIDFCQVIFVHENELIRKRYETFDCWSEYSACRSLYYEKINWADMS